MTDISGDDNNLQLLRVNHSLKMTEAFETMLSDESLCDISICCSGQVVRAHRVILAASSVYFKQILSGLNCQTQYPIIFVNGIQMQDLKAMLDFMYRGQVTIPQAQLPSLIKSAEALGVSGLSQLDPNAHLLEGQEIDKSRTSSPTESTGGPAKRGRKRKKVLPKKEPMDEIGSDSETQTKKTQPEDNGEDMEDLESDGGKVNEKLAKSKLRSWSQQIAFKANNKDNEESQQLSESESQTQSVDESERLANVNEGTGNQMKKEVWRQSRARRPPLKYSEYTLPKGIQEVKTTNETRSDSQKANDTESDDQSSTGVVVRPPTPRLTRGRSRVHSSDDPKVIVSTEVQIDPLLATPSTSMTLNSSDSTNSSAALTPNTRSRRQTHSPSEGKLKDTESIAQTSDRPTEEDEATSGQPRSKTPVKSQNSSLTLSSLFKWRPKDPQTTTTKVTEKVRSTVDPNEPNPSVDYRYESVAADGPPVYRCSYCKHSFRSKQNIIDHIRSVHIKSDQRYVCPLCLKKFKWKTSLNNHLNQMHPNSRPTPLRHRDKTRKSLP